MKIQLKTLGKETKLDDVQPGGAFSYRGDYYIRSDQVEYDSMKNECRVCVGLKRGGYRIFVIDTPVTALESTFVIEDYENE
ncbi:MAG: hypothetical protein ACXABY_35505 [Candidatus Thorarchaeota archaeon]|jgi:hypothetical protein